jgi:hypothetical protein
VVGTDLCKINEKEYLVIVDAYSSFPEVILLSSQSSKAVIKGMKVILARYCIPDIVHSDNGPFTVVKSLLISRPNGDLNMLYQ